MKRINYLLIVLPLSSVMARAGNDKVMSDINILPVSSHQFISDHSKNIPVSHIQIEKNLIRTSSYDVILIDGTNVEFNHKGEWKEIRRHGLPIPPTIILEVIQDLIRKNYSSNKVAKIEEETRDYETRLDNGPETTFDLRGNLIDVDD